MSDDLVQDDLAEPDEAAEPPDDAEPTTDEHDEHAAEDDALASADEPATAPQPEEAPPAGAGRGRGPEGRGRTSFLVLAVAVVAVLAVVVVALLGSLRSVLRTQQENRAQYLDGHGEVLTVVDEANSQSFAAVSTFLDEDLAGPTPVLETLQQAQADLEALEVPDASGFREESARLTGLVEAEGALVEALGLLVVDDPIEVEPELGDQLHVAWDEVETAFEESSRDAGLASPPLDEQADLVDALAATVVDTGVERRALRDEVAAREEELAPRRAALQLYAVYITARIAEHRGAQEELEAADWGGQELRNELAVAIYEETFVDHAERRYDVASNISAADAPSDALLDAQLDMADLITDLGVLVDEAYYAGDEAYCYEAEYVDEYIPDPFDPFDIPPEPADCMTVGETFTYEQYLDDQRPVQADLAAAIDRWIGAYEDELRNLYAT
jgi:hypothetical protein